MSARPHRRFAHALASTLLLASVAAPAWTAEPAAPTGPDPAVVVARTVHPRIAYRALPVDENPVRIQATTFPGHVFHSTLDAVLLPAAGEADLAARGNAGLAGRMAATTGLVSGVPLAMPASALPIGAGGRTGVGASGPSVVGMTAGIADTVLRAVGVPGGGP